MGSRADLILLDYNDGGGGPLHGADVRDGSFDNVTGGAVDQQSFSQSPNWTNLAGAQTAQATRSNLLSPDGGRNAVVTINRVFGQDLGYVVAAGDTFDMAFKWRDASGWEDGSDRIELTVFTTLDNTLTGTRADELSLLSGLSQVNSTFQAETLGGGSLPVSALGRSLFVEMRSPNAATSDFARVDSLYVHVFNAIPEPNPMGLMVLGGALLGVFRRRWRATLRSV